MTEPSFFFLEKAWLVQDVLFLLGQVKIHLLESIGLWFSCQGNRIAKQTLFNSSRIGKYVGFESLLTWAKWLDGICVKVGSGRFVSDLCRIALHCLLPRK